VSKKPPFQMSQRNLRDRLRRHCNKESLEFYAPGAATNPHPGMWVINKEPRGFAEIVQWAVNANILNGDDRNTLLEAETARAAQPQDPPKTTVRSLTPKTTVRSLTTDDLLIDHARFLRKAIDRGANPADTQRAVIKILLATSRG
jgi:hypothetical protein